MAQLRTDVLARLLFERLLSLGPMTEPAAMVMLEDRAPGRGFEVIDWARHAGMLRVVPGNTDEPPMLEPVRPVQSPIALDELPVALATPAQRDLTKTPANLSNDAPSSRRRDRLGSMNG